MHQDELIAYLNGELNYDDWEPCLAEELQTYEDRLKLLGSSIGIKYDGDRLKIQIGRKEVDKLYQDFKNGTIHRYFLGYLSEALLLSENTVFENESLRDVFEELAEIVETNHPASEILELLCKNQG